MESGAGGFVPGAILMPRIHWSRIGVAFDMRGCPNRCRHCYLGSADSRRLSVEAVRWGASRFREYIDGSQSSLKKLSVASWFREPDYGDEYRQLYDLEAELTDGKPMRYELLSVWRLARDRSYAAWARSVGPDTCQISFFGSRKTNDWFYRRSGAFDDALVATERLLEVGMKPRWQLFLTTKLLPELDTLLALVDRLRLRERVRALGGRFVIFMHPPGPDHEARKIEDLRPTAAEVAGLPESILAPTRQHRAKETLWETEAALYARILRMGREGASDRLLPDALWLFVRSDWDVFSNLGTLEPWWCLGNLKSDPVDRLIRRFEEDDIPGLRTLVRTPAVELAERYGDSTGRKIYSNVEDLLALYRAQHCEAQWTSRGLG